MGLGFGSGAQPSGPPGLRSGSGQRRARLGISYTARTACSNSPTLSAARKAGAACAWLPVLVDYEAFGGFPHRVVDEVGRERRHLDLLRRIAGRGAEEDDALVGMAGVDPVEAGAGAVADSSNTLQASWARASTRRASSTQHAAGSRR